MRILKENLLITSLILIFPFFLFCGKNDKSVGSKESDEIIINEGKDYYQKVLNETNDHQKALESVIDFYSSKDYVELCTLGKDEETVVIKFEDGLEAYILNPPEEASSAESIQYSSKINNPINKGTKKFKIMEMIGNNLVFLGEGPDIDEDLLSIKSLFETNGFLVDYFPQNYLTIDSLKTIYKYGVVIINAHGGLDENGNFIFQTGEKFDEFKRFVNSPYLDCRSSVGWLSKEYYFCVKPIFFDNYLSNFTKSIIYMDSCHSLEGTSLAEILVGNKKAQVYIGWDDAVFTNKANNTLNTFFDLIINNKLTVEETFIEGKEVDNNFGKISGLSVYEGWIDADLKYYPDGGKEAFIIEKQFEEQCIPSEEICDGIDNDCDGEIDEGLTFDNDGDGFTSANSCKGSKNDCNDENSSIYPGAIELCDGIDNQCPGDVGYSVIDENCPCSPIGSQKECGTNVGECQKGTQSCLNAGWGECSGSIVPINEICDGKDNDCDGQIDEDNVCNPSNTPVISIPNAPSNLQATAVSSSQINLTWMDNSNNEEGFKIERKTGVGGTYSSIYTAGSNVISYSDTGLSPRTTYYYQVYAYNSAGNSGYSNEANATTQSFSSIPAGCFNMGDAFNEGGSDERPVHNICISAFQINIYEITNAEYKSCVSAGSCTAPGNSSSNTRSSYYGNSTYNNYPVIYVNWPQANTYCVWAGGRLPTEAEWEYAARGGLAGKRYSWGDSAPTCTLGANNGAKYYPCSPVDTIAVGSFMPNGYGLYDMVGNVWEWVSDWYNGVYYSSSPTNDPPGPSSGSVRVLRGGAWDHYPIDIRTSIRRKNDPSYKNYHLGFRCAK